MFIGHFAAAFAAKKVAPDVSLGVLFLACQLADLVWPIFVLLGFEQFEIDPGNTAMTPLAFTHYPYSHSLAALLIWGLAFGAACWATARAGPRAAILIAALVLSHWALDALTHRADMPIGLAGGSTRVGLGLWNRPAAAIGLELALYAAGVWLYARSTVPRDRIGRVGLWSLVGFLGVVYFANLIGPPPPSTAAVAGSAQAMWLLVIWAFWLDRHRRSRAEPTLRIA